jgi:hypothetical protein
MSNTQEQHRHCSPWIAAANITKWRFIEQATDPSQIQQAQVDSIKVVGISKAAIVSGAAGDAVDDGIAKLEVNAAGSNIAVGDNIESGANGIGVLCGAGQRGHAVALQAATTDGAVIHVRIALSVPRPA